MGAKNVKKILHSRLSKYDIKADSRGKIQRFLKICSFPEGGGAYSTIKGLHSGPGELWRNACWQTGIKESGTPQAKYHTPRHR